jgi:hypothetical protein
MNRTSVVFDNVSIPLDNATELSSIKELNSRIVISPSWVDYNNRLSAYPAEKYFTGYSSEKKTNNDESINDVFVKLQSNNITQINEQIALLVEKIKESKNSLKTIFSGLQNSIVTTEVFYNEQNQTAQVFSFITKRAVKEYYKSLIILKSQEAEQKIKDAVSYVSADNKQSAIKEYFESMTLINQMQEANLITSAIEMTITDENIAALKQKVESGLASLQQSGINTIDDLCAYFANSLKLQADLLNGSISLNNFTYSDKNISSTFSARITSALQTKLASIAGFKICARNGISEQNLYSIGGIYWEEADKLKIQCWLKDSYQNIIGSAEAYLPQSVLKNLNIDWKPNNFETAVKNETIFTQSEIPDGNLSLQFATNKGNKNPIFKNNDTLKIMVKANKECYLRILDYLNDGSIVLLMDNFKIDAENINKVYTLPNSFYCSEPFGAEVLQLLAQTTKPFEPLTYNVQDGYKFVQGDVNSIVSAGRRCFRDIVEHSEVRINLTTIAK